MTDLMQFTIPLGAVPQSVLDAMNELVLLIDPSLILELPSTLFRSNCFCKCLSSFQLDL